jgi:dTDP-4-dehydrorhamnose reductase
MYHFTDASRRIEGSVPSEEYPTRAIRPRNSRLSKRALTDAGFSPLPDWRDALERYLAELAQQTNK